jgi:uncharacterized protein
MTAAEQKHIDIISNHLGIDKRNVKNTVDLFSEGATIPFIARYRKERTGSLDEVQIGDIFMQMKRLSELEQRRLFILQSVEEQGKLTPELRHKIENTYDSNELEDLYLPYKKKRKTRADVARELGLEPLAKSIMSQRNQNIQMLSSRYVSDKVPSAEAAVDGASDIIAEWVSEDQEIRDRLRQNCRRFATIHSKVIEKNKDKAEKYQDYFSFSEVLHKCPSHRFLAMMRGVQEEMLKVHLEIDEEKALQMAERKYIRYAREADWDDSWSEAVIIAEAIRDSFKRLLFPSIETQILNEWKEKSDEEAIRVFAQNLRQLLLSPPLGQKPVLALDPGFRTGCKLVCLDASGNLLEYTTVFPHPPQNQKSEAMHTIRYLVDKYDVSAIAIGNGTASRETKAVVEQIQFDRKVEVFVVNESGASIYSASETAREEFPDYDITVRGAASIGRRLMDPLAELVKIDAKSIGVGQYQHDVHQGKLRESLDLTVVSCVNSVGVNLNTASHHLLTFVAGLGPSVAKNIVEYRRQIGSFDSIQQLKKVPRLGDKAFEQAAGFLRIRDGKHPLDNTGVHPESYRVVERMASMCGVSLENFIADKELRKKIKLEDFIDEKVGLPTLKDIMKELEKPGLDPRGEAHHFEFEKSISSIEDIAEGMVVPGIVTNMTNFGAFVDIGVKQDGLLHISQISRKFITNPAEILHLGQELQVKVTGVDAARKRINLSLLF